MRNLGAILAMIGGGGQSFLRQRQVDDQMDFQRDQLASIDRAREAEAERDRAYATSMAQKAAEDVRQRDATLRWLRQQEGMSDLPDGVDVGQAMRDLLSRRSDTTRRVISDNTNATSLERAAMTQSAAMERLMAQMEAAMRRTGVTQAGADRRSRATQDALMERLQMMLDARSKTSPTPATPRAPSPIPGAGPMR